MDTTLSPFLEGINSNFSNTSLNYTLPESSIMRQSVESSVVFIAMYLLIFVTGVIGNCMAMLVIYRKPQMQSVTNIFIFNLAVADLLVILFCVPATLTATIITPWILGSFMCKIMPYIQGVSVSASAYSLTAIALGRCQGMCKPMQRRQGLSNYQAHILIALIWFISLIITIPWIFVFQVEPFDDIVSGPFCMEKWETKEHEGYFFIGFNLIFCFGLPLLIILIANVCIWKTVARREMPQNSASITTITNFHRKTRKEVKRMLTIVTLTFLLCWLPLYLIISRIKLFPNWSIQGGEKKFLNVMIPWAQLLGSFNSCVNPIIYVFVNSKFRRMFKSILCRSYRANQSFSFQRINRLRHRASNTTTSGCSRTPRTSGSQRALVSISRSSNKRMITGCKNMRRAKKNLSKNKW